MDKIIKIQKPFNEQYTLIIDSDMKGVNVHMTSKTLVRWDLNILKVSDEGLEIRLILLNHDLLEANSPLIKEVGILTQVFSRMYKELHFTMNHQGIVQNILNMDFILSKWKEVKSEMEKIAKQTPDIEKAILLHDSIFQNPEKLKQGIQANEFINTAFINIYGYKIPYNKSDLTKPNFFNTANVQWNLSSDIEESENNIIINTEMKPTVPLTPGFYNRAYSQFSDKIDISKLSTNLKEIGKYKIERNSGRLIESRIEKAELAHPELYIKLSYSLMSEQVYMNKIKDENNINIQMDANKSTIEGGGEENYKEYQGKKYTKEEWIKFEQKKFEEYAQKHNISSEEKKPKKGGKFFLDEKDI